MAKGHKRPHIPTVARAQRQQYDPRRILKDLDSEKSYLRSEDPAEPQLDYYIGRIVFNSEGVVNDLRAQLPKEELLDHQGSLVIPLMARHALTGTSRGTVRDLLRKIHTVHAETLRPKELVVGPAVSYHPRRNSPRSTVAIGILEGDNGILTVNRECKIVSAATSTRIYRTSPNFRVLEADHESSVEAAKKILNESHLTEGVVELGPIQICEAPAKQTTMSRNLG